MHSKPDTTLDLGYDILRSGFPNLERPLLQDCHYQGMVVAIFQLLSGPRRRVIRSCYYIAMKTKRAAFYPLTRAGLTIGCCRVSAQPGLLGSVSFPEIRLLIFPAVADDSWPSLCHVVGRESR